MSEEKTSAEHTDEMSNKPDSLSRQTFNRAIDVLPETYGEELAMFGFYPPCEGHEWDNRTSAENFAWLIPALVESERDACRDVAHKYMEFYAKPENPFQEGYKAATINIAVGICERSTES